VGNDTISNSGDIETGYGYFNAGIASVDVDPAVLLDVVNPFAPTLDAPALSGSALPPSTYCISDNLDTPCSDDTYVNDGSISATYGYVNVGVIDVLGNDSYTNNGSISATDAEILNAGILDVAGNNEVVNNGSIEASNGTINIGIGTLSLDALLNQQNVCVADPCGPSGVGNDTITNNGSVVATNGEISIGIASGLGDDTINLNDGSTTIGDDAAVLAGDGSDTVKLGSAGVSYGTQCGDIKVTTVVDKGGPKVGGLIDGDGIVDIAGGSDTLVISVTSDSDSSVADLQARLDALDPENGSITIGDNTYNFSDFENLRAVGNIFTLGPTKLYDDGVVLAFTSPSGNGIDLCDGPKGLLAGNIDFNELDKGQRDFGANGLSVHVDDLGGGQFKAHILDAGAEQMNDADGNGAADSSFVFSHGS
jgi:hypothetical protein